MSDRLAEIRARADAATPGPWRFEWDAGEKFADVLGGGPIGSMRECQVAACVPLGRPNTRPIADAEFIAHARQDIPHLLDLVDEYRKREQSQDRVREQLTHERDEARAEVERLHSWGGLLELLDEHWPADIFIVPDTPDDAMHTGRRRDTGPVILGLIRWVDRLKAERDALDRVRAAIGEHRTSQGPAATVPVWAIEEAIDGGEG